MTEQHSQDVALVDAAGPIIRPLVLDWFSADSCVATTRITIDVLAYFGIVAKPLPVRAVIFNSEALLLLEQGASPEGLHEAVFARSVAEPGGPWTMGLGFGMAEDDANEGRHVIAWLPRLSMAADFSVDQASRPHKGLDLPPLAFPTPPSTMEEGHVFGCTVSQPAPYGPAAVEYQVTTDWFTKSPNWRRASTGTPDARSVFSSVTGEAIRRLRSRATCS